MVGAVGNLAGVRATLIVAALILSPTLPLYGRAIRRGGVEDASPAKRGA